VNGAQFEIAPVAVIVFPGSGITGDLGGMAKRRGIPVLDPRGSAA
jgi:hypothetical protein